MKRDFARLLTEQRNPRTRYIDRLSVPRIIDVINREDATVDRAVRAARRDLARAVDLLVERLQRGGRVYFVGAGTSGRLGILEAAEIPPTFDVPPWRFQAIIAGGPGCVWASKEGAEDDASDGARQIRVRRIRAVDAVVGIAASGATPFVHGALREAARRRAARILVTCNRAGLPTKSADVVIAAPVGPEVITGSTRLRAGTATKRILNALTVTAMIRLGKVYENLMVDLRPTNEKLMSRARRIVMMLTGVSEAKAARALAASRKRVKVAVVMLRRGAAPAEAVRLLERNGGFLRAALESP